MLRNLFKISNKKTGTTSISKQQDIYRSLDSIKVFNYYKCEETGDLRYLLKLEDYDVLPDVNVDGLDVIWDELKNEVQQIGIDKSKRNQNVFDKQKKIHVASNDYRIVQQILYVLHYKKDDEFINILSDKYNYRINPNKDYHEELKRISKRSKIMLTQAKIWEHELSEMTKEPDNKITVWEEIESIGTHEKNDIDIYKMTMRIYLTKKYRILNTPVKK